MLCLGLKKFIVKRLTDQNHRENTTPAAKKDDLMSAVEPLEKIENTLSKADNGFLYV